MSGAEFLSLAIDLSFVIIMASIAMGFYRIAKGPTFGDRVVALDMMTMSIMAFCGLYAIFAEDQSFLDPAVVLALIGFLTTLALARFAERREHSDDDEGRAE
jgi:multisubunit Na+/H+ antiporter MnhF subunit